MLYGQRLTPHRACQGWFQKLPDQPPLDDLALGPVEIHRESALRLAITQNQIFLCYQPKIDLKTGRMVGLEALVRWRHPVQGDLFPDQFIPLAARSGLIQDLTWKVIEIGLDQIAEWGATVDASLAINLSGANLRDLSFVEQLNEQCLIRGVDPGRSPIASTSACILVIKPHDNSMAVNAFPGHNFTPSLQPCGVSQTPGGVGIGLFPRTPLTFAQTSSRSFCCAGLLLANIIAGLVNANYTLSG